VNDLPQQHRVLLRNNTLVVYAHCANDRSNLAITLQTIYDDTTHHNSLCMCTQSIKLSSYTIIHIANGSLLHNASSKALLLRGNSSCERVTCMPGAAVLHYHVVCACMYHECTVVRTTEHTHSATLISQQLLRQVIGIHTRLHYDKIIALKHPLSR
jgi:hypothetical protein